MTTTTHRRQWRRMTAGLAAAATAIAGVSIGTAIAAAPANADTAGSWLWLEGVTTIEKRDAASGELLAGATFNVTLPEDTAYGFVLVDSETRDQLYELYVDAEPQLDELSDRIGYLSNGWHDEVCVPAVEAEQDAIEALADGEQALFDLEAEHGQLLVKESMEGLTPEEEERMAELEDVLIPATEAEVEDLLATYEVVGLDMQYLCGQPGVDEESGTPIEELPTFDGLTRDELHDEVADADLAYDDLIEELRLAVLDAGSTELTVTTGDDGTVDVHLVLHSGFGDYITSTGHITEIEAPQGYTLGDQGTIEVDFIAEDGAVLVFENEPVEVPEAPAPEEPEAPEPTVDTPTEQPKTVSTDQPQSLPRTGADLGGGWAAALVALLLAAGGGAALAFRRRNA